MPRDKQFLPDVYLCTSGFPTHGGIYGAAQGGRKWFTPLTGIGCVHHIEEKDCTARFATGGIRKIPDWKINLCSHSTEEL